MSKANEEYMARIDAYLDNTILNYIYQRDKAVSVSGLLEFVNSELAGELRPGSNSNDVNSMYKHTAKGRLAHLAGMIERGLLRRTILTDRNGGGIVMLTDAGKVFLVTQKMMESV